MSDNLRKKYNNLREHYISVIMALASAIDLRDPSNLGHTERVMKLSNLVGRELKKFGYKIDMDALKLAALLHDVGKIGISEGILRKPGALTTKEWTEIKKHPSIGADILEPLVELKDIEKAVRHHQEHYDGSGYPKGLKAEEIPLMSRIVMVIDAYDAITSDRSYRVRRPKSEALEELRVMAGKQFDPKIVDIFVNIMANQP